MEKHVADASQTGRAATEATVRGGLPVPFGPGREAGCFSYFEAPLWQHLTPSYTLTLRDVVRYLRSGYARKRIESLRAEPNADRRRKLKAHTLDLVCMSGTFARRDARHLVSHSQLLCIDMDHLNHPAALWAVRLILMTDPVLGVVLVFTSPSGCGVKAVMPIDTAQAPHEAWFDAVRAYLFQKYGLVADAQCRDVARACFLGWDELCWWGIREGAVCIRPAEGGGLIKGLSICRPHLTPLPTREGQGGESSLISLIALQLDAFQIDITPTYDDWLRVAFALSAELGESGREVFHRVCRHYPRYNPAECDRKYTQCLRSPRHGIGIGTFLWMVAMAGIDVKAARRQVWQEKQKAALTNCQNCQNCQTANGYNVDVNMNRDILSNTL